MIITPFPEIDQHIRTDVYSFFLSNILHKITMEFKYKSILFSRLGSFNQV